MAEYVGAEEFIGVQKALRDRRDVFARNPALANGGRILNILDPEAYGWENVRSAVEEDRLVALAMVDRDSTLSRIDTLFDGAADCPYWEAFTGTPDRVLPVCRDILTGDSLPEGWQLRSQTHPDEETIQSTQDLNTLVGVAPMPAYYLRGKEMPLVLTTIRDAQGQMVACALATWRYHPRSRLGGWIFAGSVSVHPDHRGRKLGLIVNAALLRDAHALRGWDSVLEQAKEDNAPSVRMITGCGLTQDESKVTIVVSLLGVAVTR